jgi:tRNA A37 threonylcarbamoyladenosine biosynthesis protein TsaE
MKMFESFAQAVYFAPRGKDRIVYLGNDIAQSYLSPTDGLIGLIGDAGAGKSLLIRGMFPGLTLTNDDTGINIRPLPILAEADEDDFKSHTYHIDARFETAFTQPWRLAEVIEKALADDRRVVIEHFELLAKHLELDVELLIGIGEEVIITRPGVFGPWSEEIAEIVFNTIRYRRMAHTAEDLITKILWEEDLERPTLHSDVKSGFVLQYEEEPDFDIGELEDKVKRLIAENIVINAHDEAHIKVGENIYSCRGPRIHVKRTGEIENFKLIKEFKYDSKTGNYLLAGLVGTERSQFELSHK